MAAEALFAVRGELEGLPHGLVGGVPQVPRGLDLELAAIEGAVTESLRAADSLEGRARRGGARQRRGARRLLASGALPELLEDGAGARRFDADAVCPRGSSSATGSRSP